MRLLRTGKGAQTAKLAIHANARQKSAVLDLPHTQDPEFVVLVCRAPVLVVCGSGCRPEVCPFVVGPIAIQMVDLCRWH
jgi:hypothetical protein